MNASYSEYTRLIGYILDKKDWEERLSENKTRALPTGKVSSKEKRDVRNSKTIPVAV